MAIINITLIDKYELALVLICEIDDDLTPEVCDEIIIEMIEAGESPVPIKFSPKTKKELH
jgi:hypothetical protein